MTVKVLSLPAWLLSDVGLSMLNKNSASKPAPVRFNSPGIYLEGGNCWLEAHGRAWWYSEKQFKFELAFLHAQTLDYHKVQALKGIVQQRLATRQQRELYQMCLFVEEARRDEREHRRCVVISKAQQQEKV